MINTVCRVPSAETYRVGYAAGNNARSGVFTSQLVSDQTLTMIWFLRIPLLRCRQTHAVQCFTVDTVHRVTVITASKFLSSTRGDIIPRRSLALIVRRQQHPPKSVQDVHTTLRTTMRTKLFCILDSCPKIRLRHWYSRYSFRLCSRMMYRFNID